MSHVLERHAGVAKKVTKEKNFLSVLPLRYCSFLWCDNVVSLAVSCKDSAGDVSSRLS